MIAGKRETISGPHHQTLHQSDGMQEEQHAEAKLRALSDSGSDEERAEAQQAVNIQSGLRREAEAQLHACEHKIALYMEEVGMQQLYTDPAARHLSLVGMQMEECVQDWTLEMLLVSERKARQVLEQNAQLESDIRQLTLTRKDVQGQKSSADKALTTLEQKMKARLMELEQLKRDLAVSYRARDKLDQEIASLKEDGKKQAQQLKEARLETAAAKQKIVVCTLSTLLLRYVIRSW